MISRAYAEDTSKVFCQQVLAKSMLGAGTTIAVSSMRDAKADVCTFLINRSSLGVLSALSPESGIDVTRDLDCVSMPAVIPLVLATNKLLSATCDATVTEYMDQNPCGVDLGATGVGRRT